jgi:hypothetical protein
MPTGCGAPNYFYSAVQFNVIEADCYDLIGNGTNDTYGYIYKDYFNPINPHINVFLQNDRTHRDNQFEFYPRLLLNTTYILVVTTFDPNVTGVFSVFVTGSNNVSFTSIGMSVCTNF